LGITKSCDAEPAATEKSMRILPGFAARVPTSKRRSARPVTWKIWTPSETVGASTAVTFGATGCLAAHPAAVAATASTAPAMATRRPPAVAATLAVLEALLKPRTLLRRGRHWARCRRRRRGRD